MHYNYKLEENILEILIDFKEMLIKRNILPTDKK